MAWSGEASDMILHRSGISACGGPVFGDGSALGFDSTGLGV